MKRTAEQYRPGAVLISAQTRVTPYLLRMKWKGFPLHYHSNLGWGYIVPQELQPGEVPDLEEEEEDVGYGIVVKQTERARGNSLVVGIGSCLLLQACPTVVSSHKHDV